MKKRSEDDEFSFVAVTPYMTGPDSPDCYETDGKIEAKETLRVPERLFSLLVSAGRDSFCFRQFVARKPICIHPGYSACVSGCRRLPPG
jgi:hypothetical protein